MRRTITAVLFAAAGALSIGMSPTETFSNVPSPGARVEIPAAAIVMGRTKCAGSAGEVFTNLTGKAADLVEVTSASYPETKGIRGVVFDGIDAVVIGAPESVPALEATVAMASVRVATSCVASDLLDAARAAVEGLNVGEDGFASVGYDALQDSVHVLTTLPTAEVIDAMEGIHPNSAKQALERGTLRIEAAKSGDVSLASRNADTSPFWGGARILTNVGSCSTGFYVNSTTNGTAMVTAGHCFNGLNGKNVTNGNGSASLGTSEHASLNDPDLALIDGAAYANRSYSAPDQISFEPITASGEPATGVVYCQMGASSLIRCSTYSSLDETINVPTGVTHHLAYTSGPSGPNGSLGTGGDSGGGVFRDFSTSLSARGIVIAAGCNVTTCARWDHKLSSVKSFFSATVVTQ